MPHLALSLRESPVLRHLRHFSKIFVACYATSLLCINLDLIFDAVGAVCHQFGLFGTDPYLIPRACLV